MYRAITLTVLLAALGVSHAHAAPQLKVQQQYVKPVFPPGPAPCIACGQQVRPDLNSKLIVNPQVNNIPRYYAR